MPCTDVDDSRVVCGSQHGLERDPCIRRNGEVVVLGGPKTRLFCMGSRLDGVDTSVRHNISAMNRPLQPGQNLYKTAALPALQSQRHDPQPVSHFRPLMALTRFLCSQNVRKPGNRGRCIGDGACFRLPLTWWKIALRAAT